MLKKINFAKIVVVVFITLLIWVWADLALDEKMPDKPATITVDASADPSLWASFDQLPLYNIRMTLSGPHSAIAEESRRLKEGKKLEFDLDIVKEKMDKPGTYTFIILPFLQADKDLKQLGLRVESCEPKNLTVTVVQLVEKPLKVRCVDENQNPLKAASVEPAQVAMYVPEDWSGGKLAATVQLTRGEVAQARVSAIAKKPYIELAAGQIKEAPTNVEITAPPEESRLDDYLVTATLGISLSPTLQGQYYAEVTNLDAVMSAIAIKATPEAKRDYELQSFPKMTLYILDDDRKAAEEQRRKVVYNFPEEFVAKNEIILNQQPVIVRFKLTPFSVDVQPEAEK